MCSPATSTPKPRTLSARCDLTVREIEAPVVVTTIAPTPLRRARLKRTASPASLLRHKPMKTC